MLELVILLKYTCTVASCSRNRNTEENVRANEGLN